MTDAMGRDRGKMRRAWMPAWTIALLWLLLGLMGAAGAGAQGSPPLGTLVLHHDPSDPLSKALWEGDPRQLRASWPEGVELLVLDRGPRGAADSPVDRLRQAFGAALTVVSTPERLPRAAVQALQRFGHERRTVSVEGPGPDRPAPITGLGDSGIGRAIAPGEAAGPWPLAVYGHDACSDQPPAHPVAGRAVLVRRGGCPYVEKIARARRQGAAAVIIVNRDLPLNRVAGPCTDCGDVVLAALPQEPGEALWQAAEVALKSGEPLRVRVSAERALAPAAALGSDGQAVEVGSVPYPFNHLLKARIDPFESLTREALALRAAHGQRQRWADQQASGLWRRTPVMEGLRAADPLWNGQRTRVEVALPPAVLEAAELQWEMTLACEGLLRANCPPWDYIVNLYLCEATQDARCAWEVGRWITPYWSGGQWVHDATPVLGLLRRAALTAPRDEQGRARLALEFHSIQPYRVSLALRWRSQPGQPSTTTAQVLPLPGGAMTDGAYARRQPPVALTVPAGVERVSLSTLITGHGFADAELCAEFCNTVHHFQVDERPPHVLSQPEAGSDRGCWDRVDQGVIPNQAGTWVYGRNGWCPGEPVSFRTVDISADVAAARRAARASGRQEPLPEVTITLRHTSTVKGVDHHPPERGADGRAPDARLDVTVYAVFNGPEPASAAPAAPPAGPPSGRRAAPRRRPRLHRPRPRGAPS